MHLWSSFCIQRDKIFLLYFELLYIESKEPILKELICQVIILLGVSQAVFISVVLIWRKSPRNINLYLSALLFSVALVTLHGLTVSRQWYLDFPVLLKVYLLPQLLLGPFLFIYVSSITEQDFRLTHSSLIHFTPFMLGVLALIIFVTRPADEKLAYAHWYGLQERSTSLEEWIVWLYRQVSVWIYGIFSLKKIVAYKKNISEVLSDINKVTLNWLLFFVISCLVMQVFFLFFSIRMLDGKPLTTFTISTSLISTTAIITFGWRGILQAENVTTPFVKISGKNSGVELKDSFLKGQFDELSKYVKEKNLYLKPDLTLPELAHEVNMTRTEMSLTINRGGGLSFYEFINHFRVEDVKNKLTLSQYDGINILDLAYDSGFNSKSAFHNAFKKETGTTPLQFKKMSVRV